MTSYWIKAQAPLRVLALINHLGIEAPDRRQDGTDPRGPPRQYGDRHHPGVRARDDVGD